MRLLPTIDSPADLRRLNLDELDQLADELREYIIETVAETGGHLAASLGAVELTLALHYVLDTPADKLIFDVGHQCYTHKIITGRRKQFATLRQSGGISGFCNRDESEYDVYTSGHASDSLSLALGLALARRLNGETYRVATVIGDGALTGGMAFEAMNQAGDSGEPMIVVLNDNEMSINGNVGALSRRLSRLRSGRGYNRAKDRTRKAVESIPLLGRPLYRFISRSKSVLKKMLVPSGIFFEEIGFVYLGPIDGHDIPTIIDLLQQAVEMNKPVLLHLRTVKGKGYGPAQSQPDKWHGAVPFNIGDGSPKVNGKRSFTASFGEHICQLAEKDRRICAISAAMTEGTGLQQFAKRFPQRFYDTGITEQHAAGLSAGLALAGMRPVLAVYSTFLQRAYDQLMEDICLQKLPVVIVADRAGIVGSDGYSHQGEFDISYFRTMPGLTLLCPSDEEEQKLMLDYAFSREEPCALRWPRSSAFTLSGHPHPDVEQGHGVILREGGDMAIVALGVMLAPALDAAEELAKKGIAVRVVDARFAAPLDSGLLRDSAKKCSGRIITIEENVAAGGFGEACHAVLSNEDCRVLSLSLPNSFLPHGCREDMLHESGLDKDGLLLAAERLLSDEE